MEQEHSIPHTLPLIQPFSKYFVFIKKLYMETILSTLINYAGEFIIGGVALIVRSVEKRIIIRRKRKLWESGKPM